MLKYDDSNPRSIKNYGELLIGKKFSDVIAESSLNEYEKKEVILATNNTKNKGGVGHLIEKYHFEYEINNEQEPDFPKVGIELKVTPYEIGKKGGYRAGERLVITMISYKEPVEENYYSSHVYAKTRLTLLIHYLRDKELNRSEYPINYVTLFSPPVEDLKIIEQDYQYIINKIKAGKAHELSEGDTMYLGACTKGTTAAKSLVPQEYYTSEIKAPKRAFCFKQSYMTYILNEYVIKKSNTYESILSSMEELEEQTFEEIIIDRIALHIGKSGETLATEFKIKRNAKNFYSTLAYRMLGIRSNRAAEFEKADIEVKAIRIEQNGSMKESISFPSMSFLEVANETWEESTFYNTLSSKRYLFVVYKHDGEDYVLQGCQLWNMPYEDLEEVREGWENIQRVIIDGPILMKKKKKNGFEITNNFPKKKDHRIIHIRPHTTERCYKLEDGEIIGDNPNYGDTLPDGRIMTKQSFWLNNTYILEQLNGNLKLNKS